MDRQVIVQIDSCDGHCTFDSGLCGFKNQPEGEFSWVVVSIRQKVVQVGRWINTRYVDQQLLDKQMDRKVYEQIVIWIDNI